MAAEESTHSGAQWQTPRTCIGHLIGSGKHSGQVGKLLPLPTISSDGAENFKDSSRGPSRLPEARIEYRQRIFGVYRNAEHSKRYSV
jgi:hypothetical protein